MCVVEAFEGLSKGERRRVAVQEMKGILQPIAHFIRLKCAMFRERADAIVW